MSSPKPQIGFFTPAGKPVGYISRDDPFVVIAQVPGKGKPPPKITVPVGDEELELTLDPTAPTPTYLSEPTTMRELGVDADHGETATATVAGATGSVEVHHNNFEASFAQINAFFNQQYKFWTTFLFNLQSEESDDPDVQLWIETAKTKISLINRGRVYLNDDRKLAKFRLDSGTYYAGRIRGAVSSPSLLQFWANYGRSTLGAEQDRLRINRYRRDAKDAAWDSLLGLVGALLIGLYEEITDATFAGPMYQLITGENIYGRKDSRGTALLELAFGAALEVVGFKLGEWLSSGSRRAWSRPDPDAPKPKTGTPKAKPKRGTNLIDQDLPNGTPVHPRDAGMTEAALAQLQHVGRKHGVTFVVRPANKASLKWQEKGFPYKPMAIKQKTIQEIDHHIGAPRRYDGENTEGLVGFFDPKLPSKRPAGMSDEMWDSVQDRFKMRKKEWDKLQADMDKLEELGLIRRQDGLIIDTGLSEFVKRSKPGSMPGPDAKKFAGMGTGKPITGDYDLFSIVKNGRELSDVEAAEILEELKEVFVKIQHGSNRAWRAGDKYAHVKAGIEFDHTGKDTKMYEALTWHLEGKHTERLRGLSSADLRKEALTAKVDVAGKTDDELIDGILDANGWKAKSKGEALIVVVPEPGASPIAYWHGNQVPEGTFKEILDHAGIDMAEITRRGIDANGQAIIRTLIFTDAREGSAAGRTESTEIVATEPPVKTAAEIAADAARSARLEASQQLNAWWADTNAKLAEAEVIGDEEAEDVEVESVDGPTAAEITAYMASGAIPERFREAAAHEYLTELTTRVDEDIEITDADVERYVKTGAVPEGLQGAAAEQAAEEAADAKEASAEAAAEAAAAGSVGAAAGTAPAKTAEQAAADAARGARASAAQDLNRWEVATDAARTAAEGTSEEAWEQGDWGEAGVTDAEITAYMETGAIPERLQAAAAREHLENLRLDTEADTPEITDADVERYLETGEVPNGLEEAAQAHDAALLEEAKEAAETATAAGSAPGGGVFAERLQALGELIRSLPPLVFWAIGGVIGLFVLINALSGGGADEEASAAAPQPTTQPAAAAGGSEEEPAGGGQAPDAAAEGGGGAPAGGGAAGPPQLPPGTPADKLMVVRVGGGGTSGEEGALLPIHQFMVIPAHSPTIIIRFTGEDDLNVFPDQLVYTDESYSGDPVSACRDPHFHMPEFMPTGMDIEGNIIPEPNAQGCGYGRVGDAFPIRVPKATADAWQDNTGWDPRTGDPLVKLLAIFTPSVTDAAAVDANVNLVIQNVGQVPWSTTTLDDSTFGGLLGANAELLSNTCTGPIALAPFDSKKCTYGVRVDRSMSTVADIPTGAPGGATEPREIFTTGVNITVQDEDGDQATANYAPLMFFAAGFTPLEVDKTADPATLEEPGPATFTITIRNNGTQPLDLVEVLDTNYGDLLNEANPRVTDSDCPDLPSVIESNQEFSCTFIAQVGSNQDDGNHLNEVFVTVADPVNFLWTASADQRIPIDNPGPIDTSGQIMWELFLAEGLIDAIPAGVTVGD